MVQAAASRQGQDRIQRHHLALVSMLGRRSRSLLHYSREGSLPAEDSGMSGAISAPMPVGWDSGYEDLGT